MLKNKSKPLPSISQIAICQQVNDKGVTHQKKGKFAVTQKLPATVETQLEELSDTKFNLDDTPYSEPQLIRAVSWADILIPTVTDQVNAKVINAAGPNLKLIANFGVGVNHIDLEAAEAKGIQVSYTPDVLT